VGDEHPAYAPAGAWLTLPFTVSVVVCRGCVVAKTVRDRV